MNQFARLRTAMSAHNGEESLETETQTHTCRLPGDVHHFNLCSQLEQGCQQLVSPAIDACV